MACTPVDEPEQTYTNLMLRQANLAQWRSKSLDSWHRDRLVILWLFAWEVRLSTRLRLWLSFPYCMLADCQNQPRHKKHEPLVQILLSVNTGRYLNIIRRTLHNKDVLEIYLHRTLLSYLQAVRSWQNYNPLVQYGQPPCLPQDTMIPSILRLDMIFATYCKYSSRTSSFGNSWVELDRDHQGRFIETLLKKSRTTKNNNKQ